MLAYHRIGQAGDPYPHVEAAVFRAQMQWLRTHCTPIDLARLPRVATSGDRARLPVLVTFDDGYRDYYEVAYPILKEFDIPAVNFLPTRFIDDGGIFWWDAINLAVRYTRRAQATLPWSSESIDLDGPGRQVLSRRCKDRLKAVAHDRIPAELRSILDSLEIALADLEAQRHVMTWDQVRATMDLTTYGGHLHTHPLVSRIAPEALDDEMRTCRARIASETGVAPTTFAYPDGDVTEDAKHLLRKHGFDTAFTIREGVVGEDVDWLEILRYPGPPSVGGLASRILKVSGLGPWRRRGPSRR